MEQELMDLSSDDPLTGWIWSVAAIRPILDIDTGRILLHAARVMLLNKNFPCRRTALAAASQLPLGLLAAWDSLQ
jgi:hypothetical protein